MCPSQPPQTVEAVQDIGFDYLLVCKGRRETLPSQQGFGPAWSIELRLRPTRQAPAHRAPPSSFPMGCRLDLGVWVAIAMSGSERSGARRVGGALEPCVQECLVQPATSSPIILPVLVPIAGKCARCPANAMFRCSGPSATVDGGGFRARYPTPMPKMRHPILALPSR